MTEHCSTQKNQVAAEQISYIVGVHSSPCAALLLKKGKL